MSTRSLDLLIDNTTLHRFGFVIPGGPVPLGRAEVANALHMIECLVLADHLTVASSETALSQKHSATILEWLDSSPLRGVVTVSRMSDVESQMAVAGSVVQEMWDRGLLAPLSGAKDDLDHLDLTTSLPAGVESVTGAFWSDMGADIMRCDLVRERAASAVNDHRTGALFTYGISQHAAALEELSRCALAEKLPDEARWSHMNVVFRVLFNQQLAERGGPQTYAPPPARARELRAIYSRTLDQLRAALADVAIGLHVETGSRAFAEELLDATSRPVPLIGLACLLEADAASPAASAAERFSVARALARPLRERIAELDELSLGNPGRYMRKLRNEADAVTKLGRRRLGLQRTDGLDFHVDWAVSIDPYSGVPKLEVKAGGSVRTALEKLGMSRRRRVALLSDGIARTVHYGSLEQAVRHALRPA